MFPKVKHDVILKISQENVVKHPQLIGSQFDNNAQKHMEDPGTDSEQSRQSPSMVCFDFLILTHALS